MLDKNNSTNHVSTRVLTIVTAIKYNQSLTLIYSIHRHTRYHSNRRQNTTSKHQTQHETSHNHTEQRIYYLVTKLTSKNIAHGMSTDSTTHKGQILDHSWQNHRQTPVTKMFNLLSIQKTNSTTTNG